MSDTSVFLWINGLAGHVRAIDEFFKGISNDYFALVTCMLVIIWLWFASRDSRAAGKKPENGIHHDDCVGMASAAMGIINAHFFRARPFNVLPPVR